MDRALVGQAHTLGVWMNGLRVGSLSLDYRLYLEFNNGTAGEASLQVAL